MGLQNKFRVPSRDHCISQPCSTKNVTSEDGCYCVWMPQLFIGRHSSQKITIRRTSAPAAANTDDRHSRISRHLLPPRAVKPQLLHLTSTTPVLWLFPLSRYRLPCCEASYPDIHYSSATFPLDWHPFPPKSYTCTASWMALPRNLPPNMTTPTCCTYSICVLMDSKQVGLY